MKNREKTGETEGMKREIENKFVIKAKNIKYTKKDNWRELKDES